MKRMTTILILLTAALFLSAEVFVYPGASEDLKSAKYEVTVIQADFEYNSFVYEDANTFTDKKNAMTDWNHWTTFSFSDEITVRVRKLSGDIHACTIYPLAKEIAPEITGNVLTFTLSEPAKLYLKMEGEYEHPVFIFADAPETDVPDSNAANVVWYGPGVHEIGKLFPISSNKTYYLAGGAYVKGSFYGNHVSNIKILGRGILSGVDIEHCGYNSCRFDRVALHMEGGGSNQLVDGITITNPGMYCLLSRGQSVMRNLKCFGWWYETDGWVSGNGSILEDAFFKVNDDVVKLYYDNLIVRNLVIYQQMNGAPFQFAWSGQSGKDGLVENIDIVACEVNHSPVDRSNRTLICMRNGNNNHVRDFTFDGIRVDQDIAQVIGINTTGTFEDILIKNVSVRGRQKYDSYLKGGTIRNIRFENLVVSGEAIVSGAQLNMHTTGAVSGVIFDAAQTEPPEAPGDFRLAGVSALSITLRWDDNSDNEDHFVIERSQDGAVWSAISQPQRNDTTATLVIPGLIGENYFRIQAVNGAGSSEYSNVLVYDPSVSVSGKSGIAPHGFVLYPNYPNPFNPFTAISYQLLDFSDVRLDVVDLNGRLVSRLIDENQAIGKHVVMFDGSDLASGVYYVKLEAFSKGGQRFVRVNKMALMK